MSKVQQAYVLEEQQKISTFIRGISTTLELHERLLPALQDGVVLFQFWSDSSEEVKTAFGTLNVALIPEKDVMTVKAMGKLLMDYRGFLQDEYIGEAMSDEGKKELSERIEKMVRGLGVNPEEAPKKTKKVANSATQSYWDVNVNGWRSYKIDNLLSVTLTLQD